MASPLFRERDGQRAEVTSVELFFDLIFVFAVTQVSQFLLTHLNLLGAVQSALLLLAVWSAWVDTALITNLLDPNRQLVRTVLFMLTGIGLVFSAALPNAFGERGMAFGLAFVAFQLGRTLFVLWATRKDPVLFRDFRRIAIWATIYCGFWIAGGFAETEARLAIWTVALLLDYVPPTFGFPVPRLGRLDTSQWGLDGSHLAERIGLFIMIALGESVVVTGTVFSELRWTLPVVAAMVLALLQSIAMWWIYFFWSYDFAKEVIAHADDPGRFIRRAYGYVPWLIVAGIVASAVGNNLVIDHPLDRTEAAAAWVLIGGPALFLFGAVMFELGAFRVWSFIRIGGMVATILLAFLAPSAPPLALLTGTTAILLVVAAAERLWLARHKKVNLETVAPAGQSVPKPPG
jgi:low temperature requirement protein LtrA